MYLSTSFLQNLSFYVWHICLRTGKAMYFELRAANEFL